MLPAALAGVLLSVMAPTANAQSRADAADDLDSFAIAHLDAVQPLSIRDNAEYCGLIDYDLNGDLTATPARQGGRNGCNPGIEPDGFEVVASYHTHGAYSPDANTEAPSVDDLLGDFEEGIDAYIATPSGRVWLNILERNCPFSSAVRDASPPIRNSCPARL
ncbi:MAG: DUF4329 domain-containing protein [Hyphomicrobiales bacterium]|nr:DUF4329 domain-containing protein [Hyphomicrobiales bacterium]